MLHVALWEPEIPPNTGNIGRTCAAVGAALHIIGQPGFRMDDRTLRRAGLDYWEFLTLHQHATLQDFEQHVGTGRIICFSAHATRLYTKLTYRDGDYLLFGRESAGLPASLLGRYAETTVTLPMPGKTVRSLNLAVAAGIAVYEALRQIEGW